MNKKFVKNILPYYSLSFLSALTVFGFSTQISIPNHSDFILKIVCYLLLIEAIISKRTISKKELMLVFVFVFAAFYSMIITKSTSLATTIIVLLSVNKLDLKKSFRYIFVGTIASIFINLVVTISRGAFFEYIYYRDMKRYTLGFNSPNIMGTYVLWGSILLYQLLPTKKTIAICSVLCGLVFYATNCRSLAVTGIFFLVLLIANKYRALRRVLKVLALVIVPVLSVLTIVAVMNIDTPFGRMLDELFTHRLYLGSLAIQENGLTLIPQIVSDEQSIRITHNNFTIDNGYILFFYKNGIIFLIIAAIRLVDLIRKRKLNNYEIVAIITQAIHMLFEVHSINVLIGFPLFYIFRTQGMIKEKDEK